MVDYEELKTKINLIDKSFLTQREIKELPNILWDNENFLDIVTGMYNSGNGVLVLTDRRLIFVDKGLIWGLKVEDFPLDKISSIQYETKMIYGEIIIFTSGNKAKIEWVDKGRTKIFAENVRNRISNKVKSKFKCSDCGEMVNENEDFCSNCGVSFVDGEKCKKCNHLNKKDSKFCSKCGNKHK